MKNHRYQIKNRLKISLSMDPKKIFYYILQIKIYLQNYFQSKIHTKKYQFEIFYIFSMERDKASCHEEGGL